MDDLGFTSFSTVFKSYQDNVQPGDNEILSAMEPCLQLKRTPSQAGLDSIDQ